jgi:hypothetical protein
MTKEGDKEKKKDLARNIFRPTTDITTREERTKKRTRRPTSHSQITFFRTFFVSPAATDNITTREKNKEKEQADPSTTIMFRRSCKIH